MSAPMRQGLARLCQLSSKRGPGRLNWQVSSRTAFFRKKKEEKEEEERAAERRKIMHQFDGAVAADTLQVLKKRKSIETVKGYKPPDDVEPQIARIAEDIYGPSEDWRSQKLTDRTLKFRFLTKVIQKFDHDIPSMALLEINSVEDVLQYYQTEVRDTCAYEDLRKLDLPKNLHMNLDPIRFDPENDPIYGGKTAFPGSPTKVTSIKYRRKYKGHDG